MIPYSYNGILKTYFFFRFVATLMKLRNGVLNQSQQRSSC